MESTVGMGDCKYSKMNCITKQQDFKSIFFVNMVVNKCLFFFLFFFFFFIG